MPRKPSDVSKDVAQRIIAAKPPEFSDTDWANLTRLTPQILSNYRSGSGASLKAVASVVEGTKINARWLLTGEGPQWQPDSEEPTVVHRQAVTAVLQQVRECLADIEQREIGGSRRR